MELVQFWCAVDRVCCQVIEKCNLNNIEIMLLLYMQLVQDV